MKRRTKRSTKPTLRALSEALGVSTRRISQLKNEGLPTGTVEAAVAWHREKSASVEVLRARRVQVLEEQREKLKMENQVRRGELIPAAEVEESVMRTMAAARASLTKSLLDELPPQLEGLPASAIAKRLKGVLLHILTQLSTARYYDSPEVVAIVSAAKTEATKSK